MVVDFAAQAQGTEGTSGKPRENVPTSSDIKALESQLRAIPQGEVFQTTRAHLEARIAEFKRATTQSKSPSEQLMTCSSALERARKRFDAAQAALAAATTEHQAASFVVDHLSNECSRLQAQVAPRQNSSEGMSEALRQVITEMESSTVLPSHVVSEAKTAMQSLFGQVSAVASEANRLAAATATKKTDSGTKRSSSTPPLSPSKAQAAAPVGAAQKRPERRILSKTLQETPVLESYGNGLETVPCMEELELVPREASRNA